MFGMKKNKEIIKYLEQNVKLREKILKKVPSLVLEQRALDFKSKRFRVFGEKGNWLIVYFKMTACRSVRSFVCLLVLSGFGLCSGSRFGAERQNMHADVSAIRFELLQTQFAISPN